DFEGASFYRVVRMDNQPNDSIRIEVIQGNFTASENSVGPIEHETNDKSRIKHKDGIVSMARSKPGTASVAFFICINDQPSLDYGGMRNPDGQGFAAFGKVTSGMDIVKKIQQGETDHQTLKQPVNIIRIYKK
ncbi:MAG: peptidylprolyl isomerase, partial [Cyclobacteriaceae bacterium]